jgi:hypothetical protein
VQKRNKGERRVLLVVIIAFRTVNCMYNKRTRMDEQKIRGRGVHINSSRVCGGATWFHPSFSSSYPLLGVRSPILASSYSSLSAMGSYKGRVLTRPSMRSSQARPRIGFLCGLRDCRPRRGLLGMREVISDSFSSASSRSSVDVVSAKPFW